MIVRYLLQGVSLVLRDKSLLRYIYGPLLLSAVVFLVVVAVLYAIGVGLIAAGVGGLGTTASAAGATGVVLVTLVLIFASGALFYGIVGFLSSFLWERLSEEVERRAGSLGPSRMPSHSALIADSVKRGTFSLAGGLLAACCGWALFGIPTVLFAGLIAVYDFTAPALLRRGITFRYQRRAVRSLDEWGSFLIACGIVSLVPLLNVLMLPAMVAGGTLMVVANEKAGRLSA